MRKLLIIVLCTVLIILLAVGSTLLALVYGVRTNVSTDLSALNLPKVHVYRDLYMQCGDGFFAYVMPWYASRDNPGDLRADAMNAITSAEGWHTEPVTAAEFDELLRACQVGIPLAPAADAIYDAWFFRQGGIYPPVLPAQRPAGEWTLCFFDRDNGTFITLTQDNTMQDADALAQHSPEKLPLAALGLEGISLGTLPFLRQETPVSLTALEVPAALRDEFLRLMTASGFWQESSTSRRDFSAMLKSMQEEVWPCLYPAVGVTFDWCFQQGKTSAWYDVDTGLFIYYQYDS